VESSRPGGARCILHIQETRSPFTPDLRPEEPTPSPRATPHPPVRPAGGAPLVRPLAPADWPAVRAVYGEGIASGDATFELEVPAWEAWHAAHLPHSRLVAAAAGEVLGWAALAPVSERCAYGGVAEVSVYVAARARGRGVGGLLLEALIRSSEEGGIWTLQAGVFPENEASLALHERRGFRRVGRRERLGRLRGRWRDVLLLERRSARVGTEQDEGEDGVVSSAGRDAARGRRASGPPERRSP